MATFSPRFDITVATRGVPAEFPGVLHGKGKNRHYVITIDNPAAFVNGEAAIGIAIVGNTKSSSVFNNGSLQGRQVS
jgi:hypothetical protein